MTQARYGSNVGRLPKGLVQSQIPAMTIGDPVGVAAAEPVDDWLVEPVEDWLVEPVDCWLPATAVSGGLLDRMSCCWTSKPPAPAPRPQPKGPA